VFEPLTTHQYSSGFQRWKPFFFWQQKLFGWQQDAGNEIRFRSMQADREAHQQQQQAPQTPPQPAEPASER